MKKPVIFPEANFSKIIPEKLKSYEFENLIVQAGSVDITNLKTNIEPSKHIAYFKQEAAIRRKICFQLLKTQLKIVQILRK